MATPAQQKWITEATATWNRQRSLPFETTYDQRDRMAELWSLVHDGGEQVVRTFRELPEPEIQASQQMIRNVYSGSATDLWRVNADQRAIVTALAAAILEIDSRLSLQPIFRGRPPSGEVLLASNDVYVVPRGRPKTTGRQEGPGNTHPRRATPNHCMIPRVLQGMFEVEIIVDDHLSIAASREAPLKLGAALWPQQKMAWEQDEEKGWTAKSASSSADGATIKAQVKGCADDRPFAAVWPELSMSPPRLAALSAALRAEFEWCDPLESPLIIAAGSWHEQVDGETRNVLKVLDRAGNLRIEIAKISRFFGGGLKEGNVADQHIKVLWTPDGLVSFAICSDFCDLAIPPPPFIDLDVDFLLIPSLGNRQAFVGHEANRLRRAIVTAGETFLVQQNEEGGRPLGWVLPVRNSKRVRKEEENDSWSTRVVDRA
ncbi:MAG: hypothetical protein DI636_04710 [Pelagerythrobacter marensis]|nr:MAG: hypothetical protein DI636_04710 [Pelagerythrobacter marensis]